MRNPIRAVARNFFSPRIKTQIRLIPWRLLDLKWKMRSGLTIRLRNRSDWSVYNALFVDREYDSAIDAALAAVRPNETFHFVDLGANVGFFSIRMADLVLRSAVHDRKLNGIAIEGSPRNYHDLVRRLKEQSVFPGHLRPVHGLVGNRHGAALISETDHTGMNRVIRPNRAASVEVQFIDLDHVLAGINSIDLLKCDIEGSELLFLQNYPALLSRVRHAVFEFHPSLCDTALCKEIIQAAGLNNHAILWSHQNVSTEHFWRD